MEKLYSKFDGLVSGLICRSTKAKRNKKLTNYPQKNDMMLQQMGLDDMFDGASDEAPPCGCNGSAKSDFVVGLEKIIWNLKRILLQREVLWGPLAKQLWQWPSPMIKKLKILMYPI